MAAAPAPKRVARRRSLHPPFLRMQLTMETGPIVRLLERIVQARVGTMLTGDTLADAGRAAGVSLLVLAHVVPIGLLTLRALRLRLGHGAAAAGVTGALGLTSFGFFV